MAGAEPSELISCGKCQTVNNLPYGLDKFKCYSCNSVVNIARRPSSACAPASPTALKLQAQTPATASGSAGYPQAPQARQPPTASSSSDAKARAPETPSSGGGFFAKLQKTVDKTMQKVEKTFGGSSTATPSSSDAAARKSGGSSGSKTAPAKTADVMILTSEEEQMQWALRESLEERKKEAVTAPPRPPAAATVGGGNPKAAPSPSVAGSRGELQTIAALTAKNLQAAELRAARAQRALAAAQAKEAESIADREALRKQLEQNEEIIKGLTDKLDSVNSRLEVGNQTYANLQLSGEATAEPEEDDQEDAAELRRYEEVETRLFELEEALGIPASDRYIKEDSAQGDVDTAPSDEPLGSGSGSGTSLK